MSKRYLAICCLLILVSAAITAYCYPQLPEIIPNHWGLDGKANGFGPRWQAWLLGPGLMALLLALGLALPVLSPRKYEIKPFQGTADFVVTAIVGAMGYFQAVMLLQVRGVEFDIGRAIMPGMFLLLILIGNPLGKVKRNFYLGIRTPWTLADERVWHATHRFSARFMVATGVLGLLAALLNAPLPLQVLLLGAWAVVPIAYSFIFYKRLEQAGALK
ncbi:SdpI family protein [Massilia sp. BJB1822]|uniref:SdpI family protein n=1 Tax=Massilia sp. BJB1822 TaxID=2744470 RepID=UPI001593A3B6|nr:SdpI family protein [Massilia sp. BJB1822]NVD98650.1 SdpI family protein [Massilia sp. BJB1822]